MADKIYTIPINEAFDRYDGCPLCRMHGQLEENSLQYVMGAAMMEPDVRIRTNELGFCSRHFAAMRAQGNRLSLALILESHLAAVDALLDTGAQPGSSRLGKFKKYDGPSPAAPALQQARSCYVCARVQSFEGQYLSNVVYLWKKDAAFREKVKKQPYFCLEHYGLLLQIAQKDLSQELFVQFSADLKAVMQRSLAQLRTDTTAFCRSFDHENAAKPLAEGPRTAVERDIAFLSGTIYSNTK